MPMFKALRLCPDAVVVPPRMGLYVEVGRAIRAMMLELTPLVEPLSLDEAFLDLSGTERLHGAPPAVLLARLQSRIERELGLTVSVGLSPQQVPRQGRLRPRQAARLPVIGRAETLDFLAPHPVSIIWGVGRPPLRALEAEGIRTIADLRGRDRDRLLRRFGEPRRPALAPRPRRGRPRRSRPTMPLKSISHETTFDEDIADLDTLRWHLWSLAEQVSARAKAR